MTTGATTPSTRLSVEYVATPADAMELRRFFHLRGLRYPPLAMVLCGSVLLAAGGALMAGIGSWLWLAVGGFGVLLCALLLLAWHRAVPDPAKVEEEFAARAWLRAPFRLEAGVDGVCYEHGPFAVRARWPAFAAVTETAGALILLEKPAAGAMVYALPKRELDRSGGAGVSVWRSFLRSRPG